MELANIDHQSLFYFYQVAVTNNFTAAAKVARCSKSHISKSISQLELDLQTKLFVRTTRQLQLTESGEHLFVIVQQMFSQLQQGIDQLQTITQKPAGQLKISAPPGMAEVLLSPLFAKFFKQFSDIRLHCQCDGAMIDIIKEGYDVAFRNANLQDSNYIARHLTDIQYICVASNTCDKVIKKIKQPQELKNFHTFSYAMPGGVEWIFENGEEQVNLELNPTFTSNLSMVVLSTLQQSKGIAMLPDFLVKKLLREKKLIRVLPKWKLRSIPLYLVYASKDYMPLKTKVFIEFMLKQFRCS